MEERKLIAKNQLAAANVPSARRRSTVEQS